MFVPQMKAAHADLASGTIDFAAYKARLNTVMDAVEAQSDADKVKSFDRIMSQVRSSLTEQDEPYDGEPHTMWYDSDSTHYVWEDVMQSIFGDDFFEFYNVAYSGG